MKGLTLYFRWQLKCNSLDLSEITGNRGCVVLLNQHLAVLHSDLEFAAQKWRAAVPEMKSSGGNYYKTVTLPEISDFFF